MMLIKLRPVPREHDHNLIALRCKNICDKTIEVSGVVYFVFKAAASL